MTAGCKPYFEIFSDGPIKGFGENGNEVVAAALSGYEEKNDEALTAICNAQTAAAMLNSISTPVGLLRELRLLERLYISDRPAGTPFRIPIAFNKMSIESFTDDLNAGIRNRYPTHCDKIPPLPFLEQDVKTTLARCHGIFNWEASCHFNLVYEQNMDDGRWHMDRMMPFNFRRTMRYIEGDGTDIALRGYFVRTGDNDYEVRKFARLAGNSMAVFNACESVHRTSACLENKRWLYMITSPLRELS